VVVADAVDREDVADPSVGAGMEFEPLLGGVVGGDGIDRPSQHLEGIAGRHDVHRSFKLGGDVRRGVHGGGVLPDLGDVVLREVVEVGVRDEDRIGHGRVVRDAQRIDVEVVLTLEKES
jgi:hypothetical protein